MVSEFEKSVLESSYLRKNQVVLPYDVWKRNGIHAGGYDSNWG